MAHSLKCGAAATLTTAAALTGSLNGRDLALEHRGAWEPYLERRRGSKHSGHQLSKSKPCIACARAEEGGRAPGRGRRGRGRGGGNGRSGRGNIKKEDKSEGLHKLPARSQPQSEGEEMVEGTSVVVTAEKESEGEEEGAEENEGAEGEEDSGSRAVGENGHPSGEKQGPGSDGVDSGSDSESEESLRADWELLEQEAAQRLLALQTQQQGKATDGAQDAAEETEAESGQDSGADDTGADVDGASALSGEEEAAALGRQWSAAVEPQAVGDEQSNQESSPKETNTQAAPSVVEPKRGGRMGRAAALSALAKAHASDRMFFYPERVLAGGEVEVFLNRKLSTLAGKGAIELLGSFNDWQYQQLGVPLAPSAVLGEPWWSCALVVPGEAYKFDFVFHSGEVYENNEGQDFFVAVEGGLDAVRFSAWVSAQKRQEQRRRLAEAEAAEAVAAESRRVAEDRARDEREREAAAAVAEAARSALSASLAVAAPRVASVFFTEPDPIDPGSPVRVMYNRSYRPLSFAGEVWIHAGYNGWREGVTIVQKLTRESGVEEKGDWYSTKLSVPADAMVLNWVLADGPPERAQQYDNNDLRDFHVPVGTPGRLEAYLAKLEDEAYERIRTEREQREQERKERAKRRAVLRKEVAAQTAAQFQAAQSRVLYTEPHPVQAGKDAVVFYNPEATVLSGRKEVWMRGGFNRWTHQEGTWGPLKMKPSADGHHLRATVSVPSDAYLVDLVFSEKGDGDGGLYDNKGGLDYHVPVTGSSTQAPPLHIVHIALEMAPIAKVGGLGDVVTSLARAVEEAGHTAEVILPKYNNIDYSQVHYLEETESYTFGSTNIRTWQGKVEGLLVRFIEPENGMFWVNTIYGRRDDGPRFEFFCHAALEYLRQTKQNPDIIHCHDWSSAPVAWMYWERYHSNGMPNPRIVFTIHNLEFGAAQIGRAMGAANKATTVSPTYAREVSNHGAIAPHGNKFHGIRNGIDADIWDPLGDDFLPVPYSPAEVVTGKAAAKRELQRRMGLAEEASRPVVGFITRLTAQKGIHLIKHAIWRCLERGAQVVLLGSAPDPRVHNEFQGLGGQLAARYGGHVRLWLGYDEPLSHLIYAGSDIICVPSLFEPCGLTQMVAMRYGAVPVVRRTGGLHDTVFDCDHDRERAKHEGLQPNGYSFEGTDGGAVDYAMNRALDHFYNDRKSWDKLARTVMEQDWSWNRPALDYLELYYGARK